MPFLSNELFTITRITYEFPRIPTAPMTQYTILSVSSIAMPVTSTVTLLEPEPHKITLFILIMIVWKMHVCVIISFIDAYCEGGWVGGWEL